MALPIPHSAYERLPTPVARLLYRASLTRDLKKRHDYAFAAWEATFRLVVAASPPDNIASLREPSLGQWRQALRLPSVYSTTQELLHFHAFLRQQLGQPGQSLRRISPQQLVEPLPAYRNKFTTAHGSPRTDAFYSEATGHLVAALSVAWDEGLFWSRGAQLLYIPNIEIDRRGHRLARVFALVGTEMRVLDEGLEVPTDVLPESVYLRQGDDYRSLHPWVLCRPQEVKERFFLFNSSSRGYEFLDCDSGDILDERHLLQHGVTPGDLARLPPCSGPPSSPTPLPSEVEGDDAAVGQPAVGRTPMPGAAAIREPTPAYRVPPANEATKTTPPPRPSWRRAGAALLGVGLLVGFVGLWVLPGRWGIPAVADWFFEDQQAGAGWLQRCKRHLEHQHPQLAEIACRKGLLIAQSPTIKSQLWSELSRVAELQRAPARAVEQAAEAYREQPSETTQALLLQACERLDLPRSEPGLKEGIKAVAPGQKAVLRADPSAESSGPVLGSGSCVVVGLPSIRNPDQGGEIWFESAAMLGGVSQRGWLRAEELLPPNDGIAWATRCQTYFGNGMPGQARIACQQGLSAPGATPASVASSHLTLGSVHLQQSRISDALENFIDAYKKSPPGATKDDASRRIQQACSDQGVPPRAADDTRSYKVVSWSSTNDRTGNLRSEPSTTSGSVRILAALPRPTCILAGNPTRVQLQGGNSELWYPVEALWQGNILKGWMHQVVIDPQ